MFFHYSMGKSDPFVKFRVSQESSSFRKNSAEWTGQGFFSLFHGKKWSFRGIPYVTGWPIPRFGMKWNGTDFRKEMFFKKSTECFSLSLNGLEQVYESFFLHLMVRTKLKWFRTEFQAFLSSAEGLGTKLRSSKCFFFSSTKWFRNDISSISIFCGMVRNRITKFWMFFLSTKWLGFEFRDLLAPAL